MRLAQYPAVTFTNRRFAGRDLAEWDRFFLPSALRALVDETPRAEADFVEDDNRTAILPDPIATLDGQPFYLSVKGVGSGIDPFSLRPLDRMYAAASSDDPEVRSRLTSAGAGEDGGIITGELWLRGSPYGGQGLAHATTALRVSEQADLTSLEGFRIAPVLKIALLPSALEDRLRSIHWYRQYRGRIVQELRLVPSNVRIYFHSRTTVGSHVGHVFDLFAIDSAAAAQRFETNFVRSGIAFLTLFARTLTREPEGERYSGLDFQDVWMDKDAVLAPDGTAYFVDLEGIEPVEVEAARVAEKLEDQIFRSLYEFMFAYEQIEGERTRRFGDGGGRKAHFAAVVREALAEDPYARVRYDDRRLVLEVRNRCGDESLNLRFSLVDAY